MSETDLDRQVRNADAKLGGYGFPSKYGGRYYDEENPNAHKIDCVLFAADESCRAKLGEYAQNKLREFSHKWMPVGIIDSFAWSLRISWYATRFCEL